MKRILKWLPSIFVMGVIFSLSSVNGEVVNATPAGNADVQVLGHFLLFFSLCVTYFFATKRLSVSFIFTVLYGVFDELHQIFTPHRSTSLFDLKVDTLGALLSIALIYTYYKFIRKQSGVSS